MFETIDMDFFYETFKWKNDIMLQNKKLKKLFRDPKKFFRDMYVKHHILWLKLHTLLEIIVLFTQWVENEAFKTSKGVSPFSPEWGLTVEIRSVIYTIISQIV